MDLLGLIAGAVSKAREDFNREREAMHNGARLRAASVDDASDLTEDEQMQMALAMSENELLEHERQERELDEEAKSFEELIDDGEHLPRNRGGARGGAPLPAARFQFDKILDTSDLRPDEDVGEMDTQSDELLARQLQEEEEIDDEDANNDHPAASAPPPLLLPPSAPLSILSPPILGFNPFNPLGAGQQHHPSWWSPPPAGPLPIVTSSPPLPWLRDPVPPSPGPRPFFGGLTDSQLAREIQAEEDDASLAANEQPAHYRPPAVPEADSTGGGGGGANTGMDDGLLRAMEESRRDAEEQERRALREQQEQEYQETLLMDQIRESEREEEEKRQRRQQEEEQRRREEEAELREEAVAETAALRFSLELKRDSEIARLRELVPAEVCSAEAGGRKVCALVIRLANGSRLERRFWGDNTLRDVKHFVDLRLLEAAKQEDEAADRLQRMKKKEAIGGPDSKGEESQSEEGEDGGRDDEEREDQLRPERYLPPNYSLATTYPQKKFTNWDATLEEAGLCPRALVCVQDP